MTTTYTLISSNGDVIDRNLSVEEAARAILSDDGKLYEVRHSGDESTLFVTAHSVNWSGGAGPFNMAWDGPSPYGKPIVEFGGSEEEREARVWQRVVTASWGSGPEAMTDGAYDEMLADQEAE